ncbi:MAG: hypothetical protein RIR99_896 [Actinomycetota bacterium]
MAHVPTANGTTMNGATSLVKSLEAAGVDVMFGLPGGAILPAYDPIFDSTIRHILVRHEQGAGHAATGYAQVTGRAGVCIATSGPGATNLVTPLADAAMDSVPMVAITGQVPSVAIGTDAFQEADIRGITMPFTKHNFLVTNPLDIPRVVAEAFHIATTGRPGPVLVDVAKDALQKETVFNWPATLELAGYKPQVIPNQGAINDAAALIASSSKPVFYVGGGVIKANASRELLELAELLGAPVVTTLMARGAFPDSHPLHMGMPGMHGTVAAVTALQKADLLITLGARFDDRVTGKLSTFAVNAKVIHADIDPAEIGKNRYADVPVIGDVRETMKALIPALKAALAKSRPDLTPWLQAMNKLRATYPLGYDIPADGSLSPQFVKYEKPRTWLNSGGAGTMGYAVPAAMGAKVGAPDTTVWAIDGDGCFQMTNQELVTCALNNIPVKIAIINNESLGMVRQWQTLFYEGRYSNTSLDSKRVPNFPMLAEAMGCVGLSCERPEDVDATIEKAMGINNQPVVVDFRVHRDAMVWPMVAAGTSNDDIMIARATAPDWDSQEL